MSLAGRRGSPSGLISCLIPGVGGSIPLLPTDSFASLISPSILLRVTAEQEGLTTGGSPMIWRAEQQEGAQAFFEKRPPDFSRVCQA